MSAAPSNRVYGADLETDHNGVKAWVVQWAISDGTTERTGRTLETLKSEFLNLMRSGESFVYFHNLKYDVEFIKYALKELCEDYNFTLQIMMREKNPIFLKIVPPEGTKLRPLNIRDSMKKIPGSLADMAKLVGLQKLEGFDFNPGWSETIDFNDVNNWEYIKMDARIVAVAMRQMHDLGNSKSTFSGDAWYKAKCMLRTGPTGKMYPQELKWERYFPHLDIELDGKLRRGYFGGINISRHRGLCEGDLTHADVNSMYPSVMYFDPLPHGKPTYSERRPRDTDLYVVNAMIKLKLRPGKIPWYQFKTAADNHVEGMRPGEPVEECKCWHELTLTSVDLQLLNEWYEVEFDPDYPPQYWIFKQKIGIFKEYIDFFLKIKQESKKDSMMYYWAKFMLNSLYGRFGLNPNSQETELVSEDGDLIWRKTETVNEDNDAYLPYAMFITAHARRRLLSYLEKCGTENIIHCDTDSAIHYGNEVNGVAYGKNLGEWGLEPKPLRLWEGGYKRYVEQIKPTVEDDSAFNMACAGVPQKSNLADIPVGMWVHILDDPSRILTDDTLGQTDYSIKSEWLRELYKSKNMNPDAVNTMKLIPVRVPGGIILTERQHKLKDGLIYRRR